MSQLNNIELDDILSLVENEVVNTQQDRIQNSEEFRRVDETNSLNDYPAYIMAYAGRAVQKCHRNDREGPYDYEQMMIKTAALAIRAIKQYRSQNQ